MNNSILTIYTDGGSRGNPGKSACAFAAKLGEEIIKKDSKFLGIATNNVAEYQGVLLAFDWLASAKDNVDFDEVLFILDSELIVKQLEGIYKIKNSNLLELNLKIKKQINMLNKRVYFKHVTREKNKLADSLVNEELDKSQ